MGQQFYVIRNNPAPGTPAEKAKQDRDAAKAARKGVAVTATPEDAAPPVTPAEPPRASRQQPKKQTRQQRRSGGKS